MASNPNLDGLIVQWGDRLFYPGNRMAKGNTTPKLSALATRQRAAAIRARIAATVMRRAPQVMVKVTGGGRGMKAIAAHLRYISKNGRLDMEDERGQVSRGRDAVPELADEWRFGGTLIDDAGYRREAFNIMLSMPRGTDPLIVQRAAREFAQAELADHKYVMVLHDHQANPHVHISVRAESRHGKRLNPRKADLHRWRETFSQKLRGWGVDAEATRQATRGVNRQYEPLWRLKARGEGRLRVDRPVGGTRVVERSGTGDAMEAWRQLAGALMGSTEAGDRALARAIDVHLGQGRAQQWIPVDVGRSEARAVGMPGQLKR